MRSAIFSSADNFKQAFVQGLQEMLQQADLGCFILVCANAFADPELHRDMLPAIERQFHSLQQAFKAGALESGAVTATEEDQAIFVKMMQQGLESIPTVQYRQVGPWKCQFNHLRSFRPARMAGKTQASIYQPYNAAGFNFNKAFIQNERLWEGAWQGQQLAWYYNKFPFAWYHGLLVLDRQLQQPQYLTHTAHEFIWQLLNECADSFPGLGIGYNSLGAFASVNHLHFQWFIEPAGLPIMVSQWRHNGGSLDYPLSCYRFVESQTAWQAINTWHEQSTPYNLIYVQGALYAIPRQLQSQITHSDWTTGFSWIEAGGEIIVQGETAFMELGVSDIEQEMHKLNIIKQKP